MYFFHTNLLVFGLVNINARLLIRACAFRNNRPELSHVLGVTLVPFKLLLELTVLSEQSLS